MLGFPPAIWFAGDSIVYVNTALTHIPSVSRQGGYSVMLMALKPLHSFAVVTAIQHLMGLAMGVLTYALLRKYRLPRWGAALASTPILLDAYAIQLEQEMLPDVLFAFLAVTAIALLVWWPATKRPVVASAAAAMLLGYAAVCWPPGLPLLIVAVVFLIITKAGWRPVVAAALAGAVPLVLYLGWYDARQHHVAFNNASGIFLWSRTMTFANCNIIKPPQPERILCPDLLPASKRMTASLWIWELHTPIDRLAARGTGAKFTINNNNLAGDFAKRAILAQPLGYAHAVVDSFALSFTWNRPPHPTKLMSERYQFSLATQDWDTGIRAAKIVTVQHGYTGGHLAFTKAVRPFSTIMIAYQRFMYLRGTMIGILLLIGLGGIVRSWLGGGLRRWRDWGGPALLPWLTSVTILLVPALTADFSLRYVVPAVPAAALAAAMAFLPSATDRVSHRAGHRADQRSELPRPADEDNRASTGPLPAQA